MAVLAVEKGKQSGLRFEVPDDAAPTILGRASGADIVLDDERASRHHARIFRQRGQWIIEDLGSRNGILWHGRAIRRTAIKDGEAFQIGSTLLRLREGERLDPLQGMEVQGARLLELLGDEAGVLSYRALELAMDRPVRVDIVHPRRPLTGTLARETEDEGRLPFPLEPLRLATEAALGIHHPGVIPLLRADLPGERGLASTFLRWTDSRALSDVQEEFLSLPFEARLGFFQKLAQALHARSADPLCYPIGLRHIRVAPEGPLVAALELSALLALLKGHVGDLPAFPGYLPPEQAGQEPTTSRPALIYNLGALGYHLLTRTPPMGEKSPAEVVDPVRSPPPANLVSPEVPEDLARLLKRMLEKDPAARPSTLEEVLAGIPKPVSSGGEVPLEGPAAARRGRRPFGTTRPAPKRKRTLPLLFRLMFWPLLWAGLFLAGRHLIRAVLGKT